MPGLSDYSAKNVLNGLCGVEAQPALPAVFAALFTTAPTADAGSGGTEVSGNGYARPQVAGPLTLNGSFTTSSTTLILASTAPAWLLALGTVANPGNGVNAYDATNGQQIGTVLSVSGTTVTLQATAAHASSGAADVINFSAFSPASASTGTEPAVVAASITNGAQINWPQATGTGWGTVLFVGFYDALTTGNYLDGDWLGNFAWLPATITSASPGVITAHAHGYSAADPVVVTGKYGGVIPSFSQSNLTGPLAVVSPTTDTFTVTNAATAVNTSSSGDFSVRKIVEQPVAGNVTFFMPAAGVTLSLA